MGSVFRVIMAAARWASVLAVCAGDAAVAGTIIYTPTNPHFGGSPLNGPWLLQEGQAQNDYARQQQQSQQNSSSSSLTPGQIFAQQLKSQLYSSLANKISQAIFGANAAPSGTFTFEGTTISYQLVGSNIQITINDGQTISTVTVPAGP
jgi:curli production assembly/transport component CsgF